MPNDDGTPSAVDTVQGTTEVSTQVPTQVPQSVGSDEPLLNKQEVVELRKETRQVRDMLRDMQDRFSSVAQAPKPEPSKESRPAPTTTDAAVEEVERLRGEMAFERAMRRHGSTLSDAHQEALEGWFRAERPRDVQEWVSAKASLFAAQNPSEPTPAEKPPAAAVTTPPSATTDTGPPASDPQVSMPDDLMAMSGDQYLSMPIKERQEKLQEVLRRAAGRGPFSRR